MPVQATLPINLSKKPGKPKSASSPPMKTDSSSTMFYLRKDILYTQVLFTTSIIFVISGFSTIRVPIPIEKIDSDIEKY